MIFLNISTLQLSAQHSPIFFDNYTIENGLSNNVITDITQDNDGFMWIATQIGLNRFDGKDFVKYYSKGLSNDLPSNTIFRIIPLPLHRLVVGTSKGIGILNTYTGTTTQLIISCADELKTQTNTINDLLVDNNNNIIATTTTGLYMFDSSLKLVYRYDAYTANDVGKKRIAFAYQLFPLPDGNVLVPLNHDFAVFNVKKRELESSANVHGKEWDYLKTMTKQQYLLLNINQHAKSLLVNYKSPEDSIHLNTFDFQSQEKHALSLPLPQTFKKELEWKSRLFFLSDSVFAINSSIQNGLYFFLINAQKSLVKVDDTILAGIQCNSVFTDNDGRLWVGTDQGIFKQSFSKSAFHNFSIPANNTASNVDNYVSGFIHQHSNFFVSIFSQGVFVYNEKEQLQQRINFKDQKKLDLPWNIQPYLNDTLLIPTQMGPLLINAANKKLKKMWQPGMPASLDSVANTAAFTDSHQQLWIGMGSGCGVFMMNMKDRQWKIFSPLSGKGAFPLRYPVCICEDKWHNIWMSGMEGITRWNTEKKIFDTLINKIPGLTALPGQWIYITADKENNLWLCPEDFMLIKWNLQTNKYSFFHLPSNIGPCRAFQVNGPWDNCLWIQTNIGLLSFDKTTEKFTLLKKEDGLPNENMSDGRLYYDFATDRIYAGFSNAFTWFNPKKVLQQEQPPVTYITDIHKIGDTISYAGNANLKFSHVDNSVSISFTGINYNNGEFNNYAYRFFESDSTNWINAGNQKTLNFANLKPGSYTFQVKTILPDGTESLKPAGITLTIASAFYQTWWFYILCILFTAFIVYAIYQYRINQLLQVQKVRNNISSDLHDDIGARLTNINILAMLSRQNVQQPEVASGYLKRITNEIQSSGEALDDIVWSINSSHDSLPEIIARMRRYAADIFDATDISFQFNSDKQLNHRTINMEQRRDLFLVYKETITNIQKHAKAGVVKINLTAEKKCLCLIITDNGKGFDPSQPTARNGLKNMRNRIEKWKGSFVVTSSLGNGTTIKILLP